MKKWHFVGILILSLSSTIALAHATSDKIIIHMDENGFDPKSITIQQGQAVIFENRGKRARWPASNIHPTHEIYSEFDPKKSVWPGENWEFTFQKPGIWKMHDHNEPQFGGTVTVTADETQKSAGATVMPEKKGFWAKFFGFFSSLFRHKKPATPPLTTSAQTAGSPQTTKEILTPNLQKDTQKFSSIVKDSKEIWSNDSALLAYIKKYGVKQTFTQLEKLEKNGVGDCHQTAHRAGRMSFDTYGTGVFKDCTLACHSGCFHGATEEYFKKYGSEDLEKNINTVCADTAGNSFYNHQCLHGIGHGLLAWTNYELPEALKTCDLLTQGQGSCWTGAFMENIVAELAGSNKTDHVTKYKSSDPHFPCTIVEEKYKDSCYFLQTSRMMQMYGVDFKKIAGVCAETPAAYRRSCFESMGRDISSAYRLTPARSINECNHAPQEYRIPCLNGAVQDALWDISGMDTAIIFCKLLTDPNEKIACYGTIIPRMREVARNQDDKNSFCGKVEKEFEAECRQ